MRARALNILLAFVVFAACGAQESMRDKTIRAALIATNTARDGFIAFDRERQDDIIEAAKTLDEGKAALAAYRVAQDRVLRAFEAVYRMIASAAVVKDDSTAFNKLNEFAKELKTALDAARGLP